MTTRIRAICGGLTAVIAAGCLSLGTISPAEARGGSREKAWRIGTYVGSGATIAALAKGKGTWALIGAGATALSYSQWKKEQRRRHRAYDRAAYARYRRAHYRRHHYRRHRR